VQHVIEIRIPDEAWADVEEGTEALLDEWFVAAGDEVAEGQIIGSVMVVKTAIELVAPAAGVIDSLDVAATQNFAKGAVLARLRPR
jgi:pyruvate/2-oxoglutarate dehydrogenase complex dihydrolipoamide acyltransferase (E2) component